MKQQQRYVRPTVGGWLTPTLVAPWLSTYGAVTAITLLGIDKGLFGKAIAWTAGMLLGSVWAFTFCLVLVLVDIALLAVKVRTLPAGRRGWGTSLLAPLGVFATYAAVPPHKFYPYGVWGIAAAVFVPMLLAAVVSRAVGGLKPPR
jgi:hypothetical protein